MKTQLTVACSLVLVCAAAAPTLAEESKSAALTATVTAAMQQRQLEVVAARNPDEPGGFIAAMHMPGTQLLVVSAAYPVPAALDAKLAEGKYRDVYLALNARREHKGRFFVMDLKADGLQRTCGAGEPFDSTIRDVDGPASFDGNWAAQNMTESAYRVRFAEDEARYVRMLQILAAALSDTAPAPAP